MDREIKFRLHDKEGKVIGYENHVRNEYGCFQIFQTSTRSDWDTESQSQNVRDGLFIAATYKCQFIGLKDKKEIDIYEGDFCRILYTDWPSNTDPNIPLDEYLDSISYIGHISYDAPTYCIMIKDRYGDYSPNRLNVGQHGRITVIGNIYENPELIR